jgi:uncharacterized Ntn-hydrolase superfamily protein
MPYAATFSIVARDDDSGELGAAVVSKLPCVGSLCIGMRSGVGAVATKAWTNPAIPDRVLARLEAGEPATRALELTMKEEVDADMRQVGVVDRHGRAAAFTGPETDPWRGHRVGPGWSAQGNMLVGGAVLDAMAEAFERSREQVFAKRLIIALEAGCAIGGDLRGDRSAALKITGAEVYPLVDLRIEDHDRPVEELWRLYRMAERELFPFIRALPTHTNPHGHFEDVRTQLSPTPEERRRLLD